jgi:hypothetical protein
MICDLKLEEIKVKLKNKSDEIRSNIDEIIKATKTPEKPLIAIRNLALDAIALERGQWDLIEELIKRSK